MNKWDSKAMVESSQAGAECLSEPPRKSKVGWLAAVLVGLIGVSLFLRSYGTEVFFPTAKFQTIGEGIQLSNYQTQQKNRIQGIVEKVKRIEPLQERLPKPKPGEWLAEHREFGQSFSQYTKIKPVSINKKRKYLYVQPIGEFEGKQKQVLEKSCEFLGLYFGCEVKTLPKKNDSKFPVKAIRRNPYSGQKQLLSTHILYKVLHPKLPKDAVALIAFTDTDLWPGKGWNFVFGQASLGKRVGVWSLARHGDPEENFKQCLHRSIKVATHETGHMFSMAHCIYYRCNMQGSNSLEESDAQPTTLCTHCLAKLMFSTRVDPVKRYQKLIEFCKKNEMKDLKKEFEKRLKAIQPQPAG